MRITLTTSPTVLVTSPYDGRGSGQTDAETVSFVILAPGGTGVVLLKHGPVGGPTPDMSDAARWDFSQLALNYSCEPGIALYARASSGTVDLDVLEGGER